MDIFLKRTRVLQISLYAILSAFLVELVFGIFSNSLALITDSIHALLDSVVTIILLLAAKLSIKPPDKEHTYGHGKIESLGGLIGGIAIFLIALFFIYESVIRVTSPPPLVLPGLIALTAGVYTIGVDVFRIILLKKSIKKIGGATLKADFYHAFLDFGSTTVAIIGIILVNYGFFNADFIAALILGIVLSVLSLKLIYRTAMDLTDIISPEMVSQVKKIAQNTDGVVNVGPVLMRRSGETIFADVTVTLQGDVSFEQAHEISDRVEKNIKNKFENSESTIHFEPDLENVPKISKIMDIATSVKDVKGVHNVSSYSSEDKSFISLHVMVDREINLEKAHTVSEVIEQRIQSEFPDTEHITIHLEPYVTVPEQLKFESKNIEDEIRKILLPYTEIKKISRVITFSFRDITKIEIDCSFDKDLSIEKVHDIISEIELNIKGKFKNAIITIHPEPF